MATTVGVKLPNAINANFDPSPIPNHITKSGNNAILGIGKSRKKQILINEKFKVRTILPISLSYDHRIIDGAEAARFNNDLKENLGKNFAYKLAV